MRPQSLLSILLAISLASTALADEWKTLSNCRLIENQSNDGDSFHVKADGQEHIFRLYFVDTPEAEEGGYVEKRVTEQAQTCGITEEASVAMGKKAAAFTRAVLSRPFKILTRGQRALGASRIQREYAFVTTADAAMATATLPPSSLQRMVGPIANPMQMLIQVDNDVANGHFWRSCNGIRGVLRDPIFRLLHALV